MIEKRTTSHFERVRGHVGIVNVVIDVDVGISIVIGIVFPSLLTALG